MLPASPIRSVVLLRHARSTANVDPGVYRTTPDHVVPLCNPADDRDAMAAGDAIRALGIAPAEVCCWCSTYVRCKQTEALVLARAFGGDAAQAERRESFLLRELEYGDWDGLSDDEIAARDPERFARFRAHPDAYHRFYFRYPRGESRADAAARVATFIAKLQLSPFPHHVVHTHGVIQRLFRMAWFDRSVEWFHAEPNPGNASVLVIERDAAAGWRERYVTATTTGHPTA